MEKTELPKLGLVCVTASPKVRFCTVTRKTLRQLSQERQILKLREIYQANLERLAGAIAFCIRNNLKLYRLSANLFPFADTDLGEKILTSFATELLKIGQLAQAKGIRLVMHPNQYVVLNSEKHEVVANSIKILSTQAKILDLLGLPRSPWALMNIHGGKGDRAGHLIDTIVQLPENVYSRLTLENDERTYGSLELAAICREAKIPLVFDAHHHLIKEHLDSYHAPEVGEMLELARTTWQKPQWQLVHISNGAEYLRDRKHSDYIEQMPHSFSQAPWIEIEAKQKERAIFRLRETWLRHLSTNQRIMVNI